MDHDTPESRIASAIGRAREREHQAAASSTAGERRQAEHRRKMEDWRAAWPELRKVAWAAAGRAGAQVGSAGYVFIEAPQIALIPGPLERLAFVLKPSGSLDGGAACCLTLEPDGQVSFTADTHSLAPRRFPIEAVTEETCHAYFADFIATVFDSRP
jgi:hypothetical protein